MVAVGIVPDGRNPLVWDMSAVMHIFSGGTVYMYSVVWVSNGFLLLSAVLLLSYLVVRASVLAAGGQLLELSWRVQFLMDFDEIFACFPSCCIRVCPLSACGALKRFRRRMCIKA